MKPLIALLFSLILITACVSQHAQRESADKLPFRNSALPLEDRVNDLVARMTTEEKIAQLFNDAPGIDRLGIPPYNWWNEALHGVARAGKATVFPQAIGMAATFDEALMLRIATAISDEARAKHHFFTDNGVHSIYGGLTFWSPNINIFRDPRWGRGQETYGEDPYLTGRMAVNFVRGLQGDDDKYLKTVATIKHYAVHSGPEKTRHSDDYRPTRKDLYETYLPAFRTAIKEASVESVMCAYNRVDGQPACGSDHLLKDILRGEMGFKGYIVSDCGAVSDFYDRNAHAVVLAPAEAAAWALKSGTDLECGDSHLNTYTNLHTALREGLVTMEDVDQALKRLLRARFRLGMFDDSGNNPFADIPLSVVASEPHIAISQEAAEKSLVLLKNDGVLPLREGAKVAVIGPNATNFEVLVGNYYGYPSQPVLPLEGITQRAGSNNVFYAPGSPMAENTYRHQQIVPPMHFFHERENSLQPGLQARYFLGNVHPRLLRDKNMNAPADLERVDSNIDFYWDLSPINHKLEEPFTISWQGVLKPTESGLYSFGGNVMVKINDQWVEKPISLKAGQAYPFEARYAAFRWWPINVSLEPYVRLTWARVDVNLEQEAITAARKADVIIYVGGIDATLEGEEMPVELDGFIGGDRTHIKLPAVQTNLLKKLKTLGKPIVMVNFSGSAMALNWESDNLNAILQAFYPGEKAGTALARILWGDTSPSGRLPVTFYRGVDDLPEFTDYNMAGRTYRYYQGKPLYPFGHGLSYTRFEYGPVAVATQTSSGLEASIQITNAGSRMGEEVAQVYLSFLDAPVATPIRQLASFQRVQLQPGQKENLRFYIKPEQLRYIDNDGVEKNYKGRIEISIGTGQPGFVQAGGFSTKVLEIAE
jgi:beta-glucosidase